MINITELEKVLREYRYLTDVYVLDHYTDKNWEKLPPSWKEALPHLSLSEWADILDLNHSVRKVLPLSLLCLRQVVHRLAINRQAVNGPQDLKNLLRRTDKQGSPDIFPKITSDNVLRVRVKRKKQHEIDRIVALIDELKNGDSHFDSIIDIGAGLGHLSRILAVRFPDLKVKTVEGDAELVSTSSTMDSRLSNRLGTNFEAPMRELRYINPNEEDAADVGQQVGSSSLVLGLHPCGDLSATILRVFLNYSRVTSLLLFGCCYHKLNGGTDKPFRQEWGQEESSVTPPPCSQGFPLSLRLSHSTLSYAARELACHAQEQFVDGLRKEADGDAKHSVHCYRALLEWMIVECASNRAAVRHLSLRSVKRVHEMGFEEYAEKALAGREEVWSDVREMISSNPEAGRKISEMGVESKKVFAIYCLRLLLAPLVESLIIVDRQLAIEERGHTVVLIPLFDPGVSARNMALVAWK